MSRLQKIESVINDKFRAEDQTVVFEQNKDAKGKPFRMERKIISYGIDHLLFRFDPLKNDIFPFFSKTSGLKQICDYVLFAEQGRHLFVFVIELKLSGGGLSQLKASELFVKFILGSAERIGIDLNLGQNIQYRLISISEGNKLKAGTTEKEPEYDQHNRLVLKSQCLRLKSLLK